MVAEAVGRPPAPSPVNNSNVEEEALESGLRESLGRQLGLVFSKLNNYWFMLGVFVVALAYFGFEYQGAYAELNRVESEKAQQQAILDSDDRSLAGIEEDLVTWSNAFEAAKEEQFFELNHSTLIQRLIDTAEITGTSIQSISTSSSTVIPVESEAYDATPVILRVSGSVPELESFIARLEGDAVGALEIQNSLLIPDGLDGFSGVIRAVVFNRPVDPSELDPEQQEELSRRVTDAELDAAASGGRSSSNGGRGGSQ